MLVREERPSLKYSTDYLLGAAGRRESRWDTVTANHSVAFLHSTPPADCRVDLARALITIQLSQSPRGPLTPLRLPEIKHFILHPIVHTPRPAPLFKAPLQLFWSLGFHPQFWRSQLSICLRLWKLLLLNQADIIAPQTPARWPLFPP